jgi:hypothetical protein
VVRGLSIETKDIFYLQTDGKRSLLAVAGFYLATANNPLPPDGSEMNKKVYICPALEIWLANLCPFLGEGLGL